MFSRSPGNTVQLAASHRKKACNRSGPISPATQELNTPLRAVSRATGSMSVAKTLSVRWGVTVRNCSVARMATE